VTPACSSPPAPSARRDGERHGAVRAPVGTRLERPDSRWGRLRSERFNAGIRSAFASCRPADWTSSVAHRLRQERQLEASKNSSLSGGREFSAVAEDAELALDGIDDLRMVCRAASTPAAVRKVMNTLPFDVLMYGPLRARCRRQPARVVRCVSTQRCACRRAARRDPAGLCGS